VTPTTSPSQELLQEHVDLQATAGNGSVKLTWDLVNITPKTQVIYRKTDSNPIGRDRIGTVWSDTEFVDSDVTAGATYYYWIKVYEADGAITNSPAASATIPNDTL
jgi:hypothetical protein